MRPQWYLKIPKVTSVALRLDSSLTKLYHEHMFGPQVLETINSPINGNLEVRRWGKDIYITTGGLTQSGGLIKELWEKTLKRFKIADSRFKKWLILGLATGTAAKIISDKYQPVKIVGVEIDSKMLDIGHRYFDLDAIPNLKIINQDANLYALNSKPCFDFVLVDLYLGDQLPKFVYTPRFIKAIKRISKMAIFNHLFYDAGKKERARELVKTLESHFYQVSLVRELTNLLIICS